MSDVYKVKRGDGSWYTLGSGSLAKIRGVSGLWYSEDADGGVLAKVQKLAGTMGPGVPFDAPGLIYPTPIFVAGSGQPYLAHCQLVYANTANYGAPPVITDEYHRLPDPAFEIDTNYLQGRLAGGVVSKGGNSNILWISNTVDVSGNSDPEIVIPPGYTAVYEGSHEVVSYRLRLEKWYDNFTNNNYGANVMIYGAWYDKDLGPAYLSAPSPSADPLTSHATTPPPGPLLATAALPVSPNLDGTVFATVDAPVNQHGEVGIRTYVDLMTAAATITPTDQSYNIGISWRAFLEGYTWQPRPYRLVPV